MRIILRKHRETTLHGLIDYNLKNRQQSIFEIITVFEEITPRHCAYATSNNKTLLMS